MTRLLTFYAARLRHASPSELVYRCTCMLHAWRCRRSIRRGTFPCRLPAAPAVLSLQSIKLPRFHGIPDISTVQGIISGNRYAHGIDKATLQQWEQALCNDKTGTNGTATGGADIRTLWEPARLQHLTALLVWLVSNAEDQGAADVEAFVRREVLGWLERNPLLAGPHYRSAMECGLRIPVLLYCLVVLSNLSPDDRHRLSDAVFLHAWWIEHNLSLYSSRGNHTVCEASGLVFAGVLFKEEVQGRRWLEQGISLLRSELDYQILPDGGPVEQSFGYHRFVMDIYWLTLDTLERNSLCDCQDMHERLHKGEQFLSDVGFAPDRFPAVGDDDGGYAVAPGITPVRGTGRTQEEGCRSFKLSGYSVITGADGLNVVFDHGPLGMPPLYNHGHADALSVTLAVGGDELLIDPGTFRYNGVPAERSYFKSTAAHNTVVVDGCDQADQVTGFIWKTPCTGRLLKSEKIEAGYLIEAEHDGYKRLKQPLMHRRTLIYTPQESLLIRDSFQGTGEHEFVVHFHLHPDALVNETAGWWRVDRAGGTIWIKLLDGGTFELVRGQERPMLGWYSERYGSRQPVPTLRCYKRGTCNSTMFRTFIRLRRSYA